MDRPKARLLSSSVVRERHGPVVKILGRDSYPSMGEDRTNASVEINQRSLKTRTEAEQFYEQLSEIRRRVDTGRRSSTSRLPEQNEEAVRERLAVGGTADLTTLACKVDQCGRVFESVRVLAWHLSYSHTDEKSDKEEHLICLVCGSRYKTVKGKNSHLATGHRDLCILHNTQCVRQRLYPQLQSRKRSRGSGGVLPDPEESIRPYLLEDELLYDEDSDYEEDVTVPASRSLPPGISARPQFPAAAAPAPLAHSFRQEEADVIVVDVEADDNRYSPPPKLRRS